MAPLPKRSFQGLQADVTFAVGDSHFTKFKRFCLYNSSFIWIAGKIFSYASREGVSYSVCTVQAHSDKRVWYIKHDWFWSCLVHMRQALRKHTIQFFCLYSQIQYAMRRTNRRSTRVQSWKSSRNRTNVDGEVQTDASPPLSGKLGNDHNV